MALKTSQGIALSSMIESGSNDNGYYIKFDSGIMVCMNSQVFNNVDCSASWGNIYTNANDKRNLNDFPQTFKEIYTVVKSVDPSNGDSWLITNGNMFSKSNPGPWQVARGTINNNLGVRINYIAIGTWE